MRMHAQTAMIENGFVHLPKEAGWRAEYLHELTVFPGGKYDDQVDSTAQMLDWLKQAGREPGFLGYYRMLAEELRGRQATPGRLVRLRALPASGVSSCFRGFAATS